MRKIKRVAVALMTAGIVLSGAVATACGEPVDPRPPVGEEHVLTLVSAVDADCKNGGNSAYYTCSHCDKLFADKDGGTETSLDKVTLPALGHDYDGYERDEAGHWQVCERCDEITQKQAHADRNGKCGICGEPLSGVPQPPIGEEHVLTLVSAVDADCKNGGNSAYYTCSHCDKLFADKDGGTETSLDKVTLPALGHDYDGYERDEAGHWQVCERCDETTQKQAHKAAQFDFGKSDQTCEQCGYVLNKALFAPLETPEQITVSKNMSGSSTVASREAGARKIDCNGQTVDGNFYAFTGKAGQFIIITGGGIRGGGVGAKRELFGLYLENYGSTDIAVKYYLENSGAIPGSTDMLTVKAGETVYAEMIVDMQTFSSVPYSRIELGSDATDAKLGLACFRMGTLADGAYRLRLPDGCAFSDGTCDKLVTTELGNRLLSSVRLDVPSGALGFYNLRRPEQFWLGDVESTVNPVMDGDLVLCAMIARGEHKSVKVEPRATSGGAQPAISIAAASGIDPSKTGAGSVKGNGFDGYSETRVLYSIDKQTAGTHVVAGCGANIGKSSAMRLVTIKLTHVRGTISFKHYVANIGAGTALTEFDAMLDDSHLTYEHVFIVPANFDMGGSKHIVFEITNDMPDGAEFIMECTTVELA